MDEDRKAVKTETCLAIVVSDIPEILVDKEIDEVEKAVLEALGKYGSPRNTQGTLRIIKSDKIDAVEFRFSRKLLKRLIENFHENDPGEEYGGAMDILEHDAVIAIYNARDIMKSKLVQPPEDE